ncbi:MAG: PQQ-binding-like beta-propeller repeat protein, partial [Candidatus Hydrothermarchaeaceae archaeon]
MTSILMSAVYICAKTGGLLIKLMMLCITVLMLMPAAFGEEKFEPTLIWDNKLNSSISAGAMSSNGNLMAFGHPSGLIQVFNRTFDILWSSWTDDAVQSVGLSFDGRYLARGSGTKLAFYDREELKWTEESGYVRDVAISGKGRFISAGVGSEVKLFDITGELIKKFSLQSAVESVSISNDGGTIAIGDQSLVYLYDKEDGVLWSYSLGDPVFDTAISFGGEFIVAGTKSGYIYLFSRRGKLLWARSVDTSPIYTVTVSRDAKYVAVGSGGELIIFDREGDALWIRKSSHVLWTGMPSGGQSLAVVSERRSVSLFNFPDTTPLSVEITAPANGSIVSGVVDVTVTRRG